VSANEFVRAYAEEISRSVLAMDPSAIQSIVDALFETYQRDGQIFTFGNGASAALASHMACDLGKGTSIDIGQGAEASGVRRLRIIGLADNMALLTAYGNDVAYEDIFVEQLKNLLRPGDTVIAISGSGGSPNVLRALDYANAMQAVTIGFTGNQAKAIHLIERCDHYLNAPLDCMEQIEDLHVIYGHVIGLMLRERIMTHQRELVSA